MNSDTHLIRVFLLYGVPEVVESPRPELLEPGHHGLPLHDPRPPARVPDTDGGLGLSMAKIHIIWGHIHKAPQGKTKVKGKLWH